MSTASGGERILTWTFFALLPILLLGLVFVGCGDSVGGEGSESGESIVVSDTLSGEESSSDVPLPRTSELESSTLEEILSSTTAESDVFCTTNDDCEFGACVLIDSREPIGVCTTNCTNNDMCPEGWVCEVVTGADVEGNFCLPADFCLDRDGDGYGVGPDCLGPDCDDDDPDVHFNAVSLCDGKDNNCNGTEDDNPVFGFDTDGERVRLGDLCISDLPGRCATGRWTCVNGDTVCAPLFAPREERCNGEDDSCDGVVDGVLDNAGNPQSLTRACYGGPAQTRGVGLCSEGVETCLEGGWSGVCEGEVRPEAEVCDGQDNSCSDAIDDDPVDVGRVCTTEVADGPCATGLTICVEGTLLCEPLSEPGAEELCNGVDDTCDGLIDQVLDDQGEPQPLTRTCYTGPEETRNEGECREGYRVCEGGEYSETCFDQVLPQPETCNGRDDSCNGEIDDDPAGVEGVGEPCTVEDQLGVCAAGVTVCEEGEIRCEQVVFPQQEICDGQDTSCNGEIDDDPAGVQGVGNPCTVAGLSGPCAAGVLVCDEGSLRCEQVVFPAEVETCNGVDDTCNGLVDDDPEGAGEACTIEGLHGPCAQGVRVCQAGELVCQQVVFPRDIETCNGVDDTCSGEVDGDPAGVAGVGDACTIEGLQGPCAQGVQVCEAGGLVCQQTVFPAEMETCNGVDDTCNGQVDNDPGGVVGVDDPCTVSGVLGNCAQGTQVCQGGSLVCPQTVFPQSETCSNQDQSCDGVVDGTAAGGPLTQPCYTGRPGSQNIGICRGGTQTCSAGVWGGCAGEVVPRAERCNGLDEACNNAVDVDLDGRLACPSGCFGRFNGAAGFRGAYMFCQMPPGYDRTQPSAKAFCNAQGMNLAQVDNPTANVWVRDQPGFGWGEGWIGLEQVGTNNNHYRWPDGTDLIRDCAGCAWQAFQNWRSGEPNNHNGNNEACVDIRRSDAGWNDVRCGSSRNEFFCSW